MFNKVRCRSLYDQRRGATLTLPFRSQAEKILAKMNAKNAARAEARSKDIFGNKKEPASDEEDDGGIEFGGGEDEEDG